MIKILRLLFFGSFVFLWATFIPIHAEEILLKNGSIISGHVSEITPEDVFVTTPTGIQKISKLNIIKIKYVPFTPEQKAQALETQRKKEAREAQEKERIKQAEEAKLSKKKEEKFPEKIQEKGDRSISEWSFAWRSLVLPGWGQWEKDEKIKSSLFFFGFILAAFATYKYRAEFLEAQSRFTEKENLLLLLPAGEERKLIFQELQKDRSNSIRASERAYNASILLGVIYVVNLIDAYFSKDSSAAVNLHNSYHARTGIATNAFQSSVGQRRENHFTIQYIWGF